MIHRKVPIRFRAIDAERIGIVRRQEPWIMLFKEEPIVRIRRKAIFPGRVKIFPRLLKWPPFVWEIGRLPSLVNDVRNF